MFDGSQILKPTLPNDAATSIIYIALKFNPKTWIFQFFANFHPHLVKSTPLSGENLKPNLLIDSANSITWSFQIQRQNINFPIFFKFAPSSPKIYSLEWSNPKTDPPTRLSDLDYI